MLLALVLGCGPCATTPAPELDPELRAAVAALAATERYRFHAEGDRTPRGDPRPVAYVVDGAVEQRRPLRLESGSLVLFRDGERTAFRAEAGAHAETQRFTATAAELPPADRRIASVLATLPAPHELVALLEGHVTACSRIEAEDPRSGGVLAFECVLDAEASRTLAPQGAIVAIRVVLDRGGRSIGQLVVEPLEALRAREEGRDPAQLAPAALELFHHYQLFPAARAELAVPAAAARLLRR